MPSSLSQSFTLSRSVANGNSLRCKTLQTQLTGPRVTQEARHEKVLVSAIQDGGLPTEEQLKEQTEQISQLSLETAGVCP